MKFAFGILEFLVENCKVYISKIGDKAFPKEKVFTTVPEVKKYV